MVVSFKTKLRLGATPLAMISSLGFLRTHPSIMLALVALTGCGAEQSTHPRYAETTAPEPTLLVAPVHCDGRRERPQKLITQSTHTAGDARDALEELMIRLGKQLRPIPAQSQAPCSLLKNFDMSWEETAVPRDWIGKMVSGDEKTLLVAAISSNTKCTNEGIWIGQRYVEDGTSRCYESRFVMVAAIVDLDGKMIWKSRYIRNIGSPDHAQPNVRDASYKLFKDIPLGTVIGSNP